MAQYDLNLRDIQRIFQKRWKVIAFTVILVGSMSYFFGKSKLPLYSSFSSVKIEETNTMSGLLLQRLTYSRWDNIATAEEVIKSFPVIEQVAREMGRIAPDVDSVMVRKDVQYSSLINNMINKITTERSGRTNIINIKVTSEDPYEARDIAQLSAEVHSRIHKLRRAKQDRENRKFIEDQLVLSKSQLVAAESQLQQFLEAHPEPTSTDEINSQLLLIRTINEELIQTEFNADRLSTQKNELLKRIELNTSENRIELENGEKHELSEEDRASSIDWVSTPPGVGEYGIMNDRLMELEFKRRDIKDNYKGDYPALKKINRDIADILNNLLREVNGNLDNVSQQRRILRAKVDSLSATMDHVPENQRIINQLHRDIQLRSEQYGFLNEKYQEALIREADQAEEIVIVRPAMLSMTPINIDMFRTVSVGFVIGFFLGVVLAFLFETFDTSIGTIEDVEQYLEVPVLGVIPHFDIDMIIDSMLDRNPQWENNKYLESSARLVTHFAPKDPVAEAYRTLRTSLQFRSISSTVKTIVATSAALQEGKTTTLVNLSISLAQDGYKVLLVGCNLRRPTIYRVFGLEQSPGVTDIVLGTMDWRNAVKDLNDIIMGDLGMDTTLMTPGMDNLHIITSGKVPPNPSEMLGSKRMKEFIDEVREEYDLVIFDAPPILPVTDAAILANRTDGVLLTYRSGKVPRAALRRAKIQVEAVGGSVIGIVLNDLKAEIHGSSGSNYYYGRYYGDASRKGEDVVGADEGPIKRGGFKKIIESLPFIGDKRR